MNTSIDLCHCQIWDRIGVAGPAAMDANIFRVIRENSGGRDTTSVSQMYWRFPRWCATMCASKLATVSRHHDVVATALGWEHFMHD